MPAPPKLKNLLDGIPEGSSTGIFSGEKFRITKTIYNGGKSVKVFAESLSGNDFVSLNVYFTQSGPLLKPCEMAEEKVLEFLRRVEIEQD